MIQSSEAANSMEGRDAMNPIPRTGTAKMRGDDRFLIACLTWDLFCRVFVWMRRNGVQKGRVDSHNRSSQSFKASPTGRHQEAPTWFRPSSQQREEQHAGPTEDHPVGDSGRR